MPQIKLMITRSEFCSIMKKIKAQRKADDVFSEALSLVCDDHIVYGAGNLYEKAVLELLAIACDDKGDWIGHWLYENYIKGFQWWDADGIAHEVKAHENLYDLLKLNAGSRFIEDKNTSPLTPAQFKDKMKHAAKLNDLDARHKRMDELMCRQLTALRFGNGIEAFTAADKWHA